jgi:hypothetical protein
VRRALELDRKLSLGWIRQSTFLKSKVGLRNFLASLAAAGVATPVFGNTIDGRSSAAQIVGGVTITAVAAGVGVASGIWERESLKRRTVSGPFKYVYEMGQKFGLAD